MSSLIGGPLSHTVKSHNPNKKTSIWEHVTRLSMYQTRSIFQEYQHLVEIKYIYSKFSKKMDPKETTLYLSSSHALYYLPNKSYLRYVPVLPLQRTQVYKRVKTLPIYYEILKKTLNLL